MAETTQPPRPIEQVKRDLLNPRAIAKQHDPEGKVTAISSAAQARIETRDAGLTRTSISEKMVETAGEYHQAREGADALSVAAYQKAEALGKRKEKTLVKLKGILRMGDKEAERLAAELNAVENELGVVQSNQRRTEEELQDLRHRQTEIPTDLPDAKALLDAYYERMKTLPLANGEKRELLVPEVLSALSTEEYIALWRRLNPYFVSHVTRQGFRDHNAMDYHSKGLQEFHNGFTSVLGDDRQIRPPLALRGLPRRDEATVQAYIEPYVLKAETAEEARERLHAVLTHTIAEAPRYPDETAVHFAVQVVANDFYGGEDGNEIFFVYPSDVIASQHNFTFNGWEKDFTEPQSERKWNDLFVWPNTLDNPGIPVDAGLVFLPDSTPVDANTGSKYASEISVVDGKEQRVMIDDTNLVSSFIAWGKNLDAAPIAKNALVEYKNERDQTAQFALGKDSLVIIASELEKLGFSNEAARNLGGNLIDKLRGMSIDELTTDDILESSVRATEANWKRAENPISAKEYWENYFTQHPELRPKHVVYYDGDPTVAVYEFQQENNIGRADTSETDGQLLGFEDHFVENMREDPRAVKGYDELVETANRIIDDHYSAQAA